VYRTALNVVYRTTIAGHEEVYNLYQKLSFICIHFCARKCVRSQF